MGHRPFMVIHLEILERNAEGQSACLDVVAFLCQIVVDGFTLTEMDHTPAGGEMREQGTGQNDDKGKMEHHGEDLPHAPFHEPGNACGCQQSP